MDDATQAPPARDREADRARFPDPAFNEWLDTGISDAGHIVWHQVGDTADAWAGWEARQFAPVTADPPTPIDDDALPRALWPVANAWYELCERRHAVDSIRISGDLARAIVDAISEPRT